MDQVRNVRINISVYCKWVTLGSMHVNTQKRWPAVNTVRYTWNTLAQKFLFNPYSHSKLTLWMNPTLKIYRESFLWRTWADRTFFTLDQEFAPSKQEV